MKRGWVWVVLLLSLGINVGILATLWTQRVRRPVAPASASPQMPAEPAPAEPAPAAAQPPAGAPQPAAIEPEARRAAAKPRPPAPPPVPETSSPRASSPEPAPLEALSREPAPPLPAPDLPPPSEEEAAAPVPGGAEPLGPGRGPRFELLADRLGLAGELRLEFIALQRRAFETMRAQRQRLVAARAALRREMVAPSPDRARLQALVAETNVAQQELERTFVNSLIESRALLDARQQRLYMHFVEERLRPGDGPPPRRPLRDRLFNRRGVRP